MSLDERCPLAHHASCLLARCEVRCQFDDVRTVKAARNADGLEVREAGKKGVEVLRPMSGDTVLKPTVERWKVWRVTLHGMLIAEITLQADFDAQDALIAADGLAGGISRVV